MKGNLDDEIENNVYEYRVLNKLSQKELAEHVGVSKQTIFVMEKNKYSPSLLLAFRIANYFNTDVTDIFHYKRHNEE